MNHISDLLEDINADGFFNSDESTDAPPASPATDTPLTNVLASKAPESPEIDTAAMKAHVLQIQSQLNTLLSLIDGAPTPAPVPSTSSAAMPAGGQVLEGVFNGRNMIGQDGKEYPVPPNYASKSKLVEGDMMKLTISSGGQLRFKQIGPIPRKHVVGELMFDSGTNQWQVFAGGRMYKVLTASVTFHKGNIGTNVSLIVPEDGESEWGAIEHIMS